MSSNSVESGDIESSAADLGPLAWVLDELRKSLDGATKALRRFVRDAELARGADLSELDASQLRIARQQLHQAVGALEMVGLEAPAKVLRAMEALAQRFVQRPELCSEDAAAKVERASFALTEFLEGMIKGKTASAVALFPQYRDVMELTGGERAHPADLWPVEWHWMEVILPPEVAALSDAVSLRAEMDAGVLRVMKTADAPAAKRLGQLCVGIAAGHPAMETRAFWSICAAYFEAVSLGLCAADLYAKRAAARVLRQYAALAKGDSSVSDRLARDLLFFCALAVPSAGQDAPALTAVRVAYGLTFDKPIDYSEEKFGLFDPAMMALARKRIATAAETWSGLAGGDVNRLKVVGEQFAAVSESIVKLHPDSGDLAVALTRAIDATVRSGAVPPPSVAMEVATAVLYLEAAYEDLDPTNSKIAERSARLAQRLEHVRAGGEPEPLEGWMEELYRRVADRQTMGSVVDELRTALGQVEASLDQFFRNPQDKTPLREVPSQLAQMRGVFSVLGLDQPAIAALRMRARIEQLLVDEIDEASARVGIFDKLGNSVGVMGFLIDMLSYQRTLAKKLFVYDEELGEFKSLMGRESPAAKPVAPKVTPAPVVEVPAPVAVVQDDQVVSVQEPAKLAPVVVAPPPLPVVSTQSSDGDDDDSELLDIFLEEAREVSQNGITAVQALSANPGDLAEQTTLRRAFHTLKGSSRMVGLDEFGEAAWSFEQLLNARLADQLPASEDLITLVSSAMEAFGRWIEDIAAGNADHWSAQDFRNSSDAMRLHQQTVPLRSPGVVAAEDHVPAAVEEPVSPPPIEVSPSEPLTAVVGEPEYAHPDFAATQTFGFEATQAFDAHDARKAADAFKGATEVHELDFGDFDFGDAKPVEAAPVIVEAVSEASSTQGLVDAHEVSAPEEIALDIDVPREESLESAPSGDVAEVDVLQEPVAEPVSLSEPESAVMLPAESEVLVSAEPETVESPVLASVESDDQIKVIGHLRLSIPLYNVYLNEADEWSRRLQIELSEWALELQRPLPDSLVTLAHSLSGSSATVGFVALSEMARSLEHALQHLQLHHQGSSEQAQVFSNAAEDIRRLLHQFAAGFLKDPDAVILAALQAIIDTEFPAPTIESMSDELAVATELEAQALVEEPAAAQAVAEIEAEAIAPESVEPDQVVVTPPLQSVPVESYVPEVTDSVYPPDEVVESTGVTEAAEISPASVEDVAVLPVVGAAPLTVAAAEHDDIDAVDALDEDLFPIFEEEAQELMPKLGTALREWVTDPNQRSARNEVLRVLHTLKGSARLAGAMRLGEMSHLMESSIEQIGADNLQSIQLEPLLTRYDTLQSTFAALSHPQQVAEAMPVSMPASSDAAAIPASVQTPSSAVMALQPVPRGGLLVPPRQMANQSVRVRSQLLDRLVNQAGEVMISRARIDARLIQLRASLSELSGNLERLRHQLRDVELQSESQMQSRLAQTKDSAQAFDPLEFDRFTRVQELTRMMAESVHDVATVQRNLQRSVEGAEDDLIAQGRQARELQRDLLRTRMMEFEGISDRLYAVVRQAAKDAGKQVKLDIVGGSIEMDRGVMERMAPAFEHMLRNSVAHGIEDAATRAAANKSNAGTITIQVNQESNDISVSFIDDGGGLHLDKIRARALANGLITQDEVLSEGEAANLIFTPGFSTADKVTELAGRGIGMDVVRSEVNALGGRIETSTVPGQGTTFKVVLPLTTAVTQVVMLRMGDFTIAVPSNLVETVLRTPAAVLEDAYKRDAFEMGGQLIPFFWAGALLQVSSQSHEAQTKTFSVIVLRSAGQRMAMHVDEVLGNREVVVKNLGPQLARLPGLAGVSVLASGAVALIYNPVALASVYGEQARQLRQTAVKANALATASGGATPQSSQATLGAVNQVPLILVVDDSITVRRVTQRLLKREGYRVTLAADGLQALEKLQEEKPTLVLSDIEMPRMDGFDLARNIRGDEHMKDLPIIMITSRIAGKHREHAKELGVDHYLGKPYSEEELLGLIRNYCDQKVVAEAA